MKFLPTLTDLLEVKGHRKALQGQHTNFSVSAKIDH